MNITAGAMNIGDVCGAYMDSKSPHNISNIPMTDNQVYVSRECTGTSFNNNDICGSCAIKIISNVSSNTVRVMGGINIKDVYGGRITTGTVSSNTVTISTIVTIGKNVLGGYIKHDGMATVNTVNLTSVTVIGDVFGASILNNGSASSNTVTIEGGNIEGAVFGGFVYGNGNVLII